MENDDHFFNTLREKYLITVVMEAKVYIGIKLDWDYAQKTVIFSMSNYRRNALHILQHVLMGGRE